jgi:hypothetical protein
LVRCRPGWADAHPHGNAYRGTFGHADRHPHGSPYRDAFGHADRHPHGDADLAARSPNADCDTHGYIDCDADGHADPDAAGCAAAGSDAADRTGRRLGLEYLLPGDAPRRRQRRFGDRDQHRGGPLAQLRDPGGHG